MNHEKYMQRCIELAQNARGYTSPNPMVGAVIVYQNTIIGEGWHHAPGLPHAEVNAINNVADKSLLKHSTIYVSLEPCAHFGRTPPCSDLIIHHKIPRVVIGCRDPFEHVNGRGIKKLKEAGIEVIEEVLKQQCLNLNKAFFTFHTKRRPYIILKWAQTNDGFIDRTRNGQEKGVNWISQPETQTLVHSWRAQVDAILVGATTVLHDNPSLTVRAVEGKNPTRLIIDPNNKVNKSFAVNDDEALSAFFRKNPSQQPLQPGTNAEVLYKGDALQTVVSYCLKNNLQSILVEGGAHTLQAFIEAGLYDEIRVITGVSSFSSGLKAPVFKARKQQSFAFGKDIVNIYSA
jgi:diaminohydroxyphosphoribosylaminopyrimidine deaminase/5-amino-6-(5-phosphoribosylamino)uracil reductase